MRVRLVGGVFDRHEEYRRSHALTPETILAAELEALGVEVIVSGHRNRGPTVPCDVVHVHHLGREALRVALTRRKQPFVFTGHDGAILSGYETSLTRKAAFALVVRRADAVVALSTVDQSFLRKLRPRDREIPIIPNGIRSDVFTTDAERNPAVERPARLLFVGQLIPLKAVDVLLWVLASHDSRISLSIAYHTKGRELELRALAEQLGLSERVRFLGARSPAELAEAYREADLLVLPSLAEALPSCIAEALLCGTPVVATDVGGVSEQIGGLGYLAPPGDIRGLETAVRRALDNLSSLSARVTASRPDLVRRWCPREFALRHLRVYEKVLARSGNRGGEYGSPRPS